MDSILPDNMHEWCKNNSNVHKMLFGSSEHYVGDISFTTRPGQSSSFDFEVSLRKMNKEQMEDIIKVVRSWSNKGE